MVEFGVMLLLVVFGLKFVMMLLYFWMFKVYLVVLVLVVVLFVIMIKVGIYSLWWVYSIIFGDGVGELVNIV